MNGNGLVPTGGKGCKNASLFFQHFINFCRELKKEGVKLTMRQEIDALRALNFIEVLKFADFYTTLRTNLVSYHDDITVFDRVFYSYWDFSEKEQTPQPINGQEKTSEKASAANLEKQLKDEYPLGDSARDKAEENLEESEAPTYSPAERLKEKDFSDFGDEDLDMIKKAIAMITQRMKVRESRRKKASRKKDFFDLRRTLRKNLRFGGDIIDLAWKTRRINRTHIVLLCDVSGSMERYSRFLIQFLYGLQQRTQGKVETFVFSTRLTRITHILHRMNFEKALIKISQTVMDWSGGTKIGESLKIFNRKYSPSVIDRKTIVIIISDGWDRGDEVTLREEIERLKQNAYHLIWLNPLLGNTTYEPSCKGMVTVLPFVDQFLPINNLNSLINLGQTLYRIS
ncbi:MAG: VWA domain-containing protein [Syntrophaceae bacterium]|nr:VWA domain-containing protein [Syntrophaceae bacterium]